MINELIELTASYRQFRFFCRKIDDVTDATAIHLLCGIWGHLSVGLFADPPTGPKSLFIDGSWFRLKVQSISVLCIVAWSAVALYLWIFILDLIFKVRPSEENELLGSDRVEHELDEDVDYLSSSMPDLSYSDGMEIRYRSNLNNIGVYYPHAATIDLGQRNGNLKNSPKSYDVSNGHPRVQYNINRAYEHE